MEFVGRLGIGGLTMARGAVQNMVTLWRNRGMRLEIKTGFFQATAFVSHSHIIDTR